jgi:hypothetical protein
MPQLLEEPKSAPEQDRRYPFARRLVISIWRVAIIASLAAFIGGGFYLAKKGFGREWRTRVVKELHQRGVEASVGRLTLDPFRGLIAQDVRIFDYKERQSGRRLAGESSERENVLAVVSEISLDINYAAFFHRQPFLNALDIRNAQITLPLKTANGKVVKAQIKNLRAHVYFPPEQIYISQAEGIFCGLRISVTGQLIKREGYQPRAKPTDEDWKKNISILQRIVIELEKFDFAPVPPSLQVKFTGDVAEFEKAHVEATLHGHRIGRANYEIRDLSAIAEWADETLTVTHCEWQDQRGNLAAHLSWSRPRSSAEFQVRSSLDLKKFVEAFELGDWLADTTFSTPPLLEVSGLADLGGEHPQLKLIGHAQAERFTKKNVSFSDFSANFSWDGDRTLLRDVRLRHETGQITAELFDAPGDFRLNIDSTISPHALIPLGSDGLKQFLSEWEWPRPPTVHLAIRGQDRQPQNWQGEGNIAFDRTRFRGVWAKSGSAKIHFADGAVTYENLHVVRDEGVGSGTFTYDFKNHEVRIDHIKTSLWPAEVIYWVDPDLAKTVAPYKFHQAPKLSVNGVYQFGGGTKTQLEIVVDAGEGLDYDFLGKTLPFDKTTGHLVFTNNRLQLVDLSAGLFSGRVRGSAEIPLGEKGRRYRADITASDINFPRLTDLYYQYQTSQGRLNGHYEFSGLGGDARAMRGKGKIEVTEGDVFAIPIFGPLSGILNAIVPGAGYSIAHTATARVTVDQGIIHTDDFEVAGKLFGMLGHGDIHFLDDKLDFQVRLTMHGAAGVLLAPVYKLFEYAGEGSLKKPDWHPKRF